METTNQNTVTDEQVEQKFQELSNKADRTEDESRELDNLKSERQTRYQKRIDTLTHKAKLAEERYGEASDKVAELEKQIDELKQSQVKEPQIKVKKDTVKVGDQQFFTDDALLSMVKVGELTEAEAWGHQRERDKEEAAERAYQRIKQEEKQTKEADVRRADAEWVMKQYPRFNKTHPDFDPNDPLYKQATEIYQEGYAANPKGLSLAIKRAKQILRIQEDHPDLSDDFNVGGSPSAPARKSKDDTSISDDEFEVAQRIWRDRINPATGRYFTDNEIKQKAIKAKKARGSKRRT